MNKQYFLNKLKINRPSVFETNNYDLLPDTFFANDKITIKCCHHGLFNQKAYSHLFSAGCPECGKEQCKNNRALTTDEFINKSKSKYGNKFDYSKTNYFRQDSDIILICPTHGEIVLSPNKHFWTKHGCHKCDFEIPRNIRKRKYLEKAEQVHNGKYNYSKVEYINSTDTVEIICPTHGSFWQGLFNHVAKETGCPKCAEENNRFSLDQFITKAKEIHGGNYDYSKVVYETNASMVTITCKRHGDFIQRAASHLAGCKCKKCHIEDQRKTTEEFIRTAKLIHGNKYDYSKVKYHTSKHQVEIICPMHGSFWQKPNGHLSNKAGCRICMESKGEKAVEMFLKKFNIGYIREFRLIPYLLRSDFFLPELNIHIEFNGIQHYKSIDMFGGEKAYLKVKENDRIKKQLIKGRNESLIVLTYLHLNDESVEKELIARLKQIYRYWFVIDGKLQVFKGPLQLYDCYNFLKNIQIKDIVRELEKSIKSFQVLF